VVAPLDGILRSDFITPAMIPKRKKRIGGDKKLFDIVINNSIDYLIFIHNCIAYIEQK